MKILNKYVEKLRYVYSKRLGCSFLIAVLSSYLIAIILWLAVANKPKSRVVESDDIKGIVLTAVVLIFSFFLMPLILKRKQ